MSLLTLFLLYFYFLLYLQHNELVSVSVLGVRYSKPLFIPNITVKENLFWTEFLNSKSSWLKLLFAVQHADEKEVSSVELHTNTQCFLPADETLDSSTLAFPKRQSILKHSL